MLRVAGPVPRAAAWMIDTLIRIGVGIAAAIVLPFMGKFGSGLFLLLLFFLFWVYWVVFEVLRHGATPGKRVMKIRVVNRNGTPVGWSESIIRNLVRFVDWMPTAYGFGLVSVLLNRDFQRLGDMAAGTVVVHDEEAAPEVAVADVEAMPPLRPLTQDEQRAVLAYGDRVNQISEDRAKELAGIVEGYLTRPGEPASRQLIANAKWLAGRA